MTRLNVKTVVIVGVLLHTLGCQTVAHREVRSQEEADEAIERAYTRADERALVAQTAADQETEEIVREAALKIQKLRAMAEREIDEAYEEADREEQRIQSALAKTGRQAFLAYTENEISRLRAEIARFNQEVDRERLSVEDPTARMLGELDQAETELYQRVLSNY